MIAATHSDPFLVFLLFAIAILFQILTRARSKARRQPPNTTRRSSSQPQRSRPLVREEETDEDQIRKFLEALGQPTTSKPPPAVEPRPTYRRPLAHVPPFGSPLPPLTTRPLDLPEAPARPTMAPTREEKVARPRVAEPPPFEIHQGPPPLEPITEAEVKTAFQPATQPSLKRLDVAVMLRSTAGLRDAIILREIFGPPRSFQPLAEPGAGGQLLQ